MTTTYYFNTPPYASVNADYPQFTRSMNVSGSFTFTEALWSNLLDADVTSKLASWNVSDGVNTYTQNNSTIAAITVSTKSTGDFFSICGYHFSIALTGTAYTLYCGSASINMAFVSAGVTTVASMGNTFSNSPP